jgi:microcystin-dependent protein
MQTPFIGNIIMFGGSFAPVDWAFCDGSLMSIAEYSTLYNLIGTTYGGDGQSTFALPDLRGRIPLNQGQGQGSGFSAYSLGQVAGVESVSLLPANLPAHTHGVTCNSGAANALDPTNNFLAQQSGLLEYSTANTANSVMKANALTNSPGGGAHDNIMPSMALNYIIALNGIYPSQS